MKRGKVKAFTIMELTIAMLISAIAIGITYSIFLIVSHSYQSYLTKTAQVATAQRLDAVLQRDFDRGALILKDTSGVRIQLPSGQVKYQFDTAFVIRKTATNDTFKVKTDSVTFSFEGKELTANGEAGAQNPLDELYLSVILEKQKITYHYHKVYSSANLINIDANAIH